MILLIFLSISLTPALAGPVADELIQRDGNVGIPKPRPNQPAVLQAEDQATPPSKLDPEPFNQIKATSKSTSTAPSVAKPAITPTISACFIALAGNHSAIKAPQPETADEECAIPNPVELQSTGGRFPIQFPEGLHLDCPFATSLADFADNIVQPLARHHIGSPIVKIVSGQGYVCRRRNNAPDGKLSEHAVGNATDWVGFVFDDGRSLTINEPSKMKPDEAKFFHAIRTAACGNFTTVLGPGSNDAHATHLHFDLGRTQEGKKNPYRICE